MVAQLRSLRNTPLMSPEDLETILSHLPEPTYATVRLLGPFDYSSALYQVKELIPTITIGNCHVDSCGVKLVLHEPSKEEILGIYRQIPKSESEEIKRIMETGAQKFIRLDDVGWYLQEGHVQIRLEPEGVYIQYRGQEPSYISQLRAYLAKTGVRIELNVNG